MSFSSLYVDYFWWGGKILFLCLVLNIVLSITIPIASLKNGAYNKPSRQKTIKTITILSLASLVVSAIMCLLAARFYVKIVKPLKATQTTVRKIHTDMDGFGFAPTYAILIGWPLLLSLVAVKKHNKYTKKFSSNALQNA